MQQQPHYINTNYQPLPAANKPFTVRNGKQVQPLDYNIRQLEALQEKASRIGRRYPKGGYQGL